MNFKSIYVILLVIFITPNYTFAQKALKKQGDIFFEAGHFSSALNAYKAYKKTEKDPQLLIKRGLCYLYTNKPDACLRDMVAAHQLKSLDNKRYKYSAMAYFKMGDYVEAAKFYKSYLNTLKQDDPDWKKTVDEIRRCGYAKNNKFMPQFAFVENLGGNVNTEFDEYSPAQSPTRQGRYYFSSARTETNGGLRDINGLEDVVRGHYLADMFQVDLQEGNWSTVLPFEPLLNSPKHDILQDFSTDGSVVYFIKSTDKKNGVLYTDTFNLERDSGRFLVPVTSLTFKAEMGDKDLFVFNDSLILFASSREGGFGGYDLYYSIKKDSLWQEPINLGKNINTFANEVSPFIVKNGSTIYFSSDRPETLGGYDIFKAIYDVKNDWNAVTNLSVPVNSPGDDLDIELSADGMTAIFASDRVESKGGLDLYMAYFKDQVIEQLDFVDMPLFIPLISDSTGAIEQNYDQVSQAKQGVESNLDVKEYISKPLLFTDNDDILNPSNVIQIKKLADLMIIYPEAHVLLSSHYIPESRAEIDLYFSIKRSEKVADQLISAGISAHRIHMQGCGSNFPLALPIINGIPSTLAARTNKRVDVDILNVDPKFIKVRYDIPAVALQYRDTLWDQFAANNQGVTFRVVLAKAVQMLKSEALLFRKDGIVQKAGHENQYTYTLGNFVRYTEAKDLIVKLAENFGNTDSKIVPFYRGVEMINKDINKEAARYPELQLFLDTENKE